MSNEIISNRESQIKELFQSLDIEGKNELDAESIAVLLIEKYQDFDGLDDAVNQLLETIAECDGDRGSDTGTASTTAGTTVTTPSSPTSSLSHPHIPLETISYKSFKDYILTTQALLDKSFQILDTNHDGLLELDDLKQAFEHLDNIDFEVDSDKIEVLFNAIDSDDDGFISIEDWRDQLTFIPRYDLNPLKSAYMFFIEELDLSSEGDVLLSSESSHGIGYFLAGGLAGVVSRTCTAPFDRLKVYLIAQSGAPPPAAAAAAAAASEGVKTAASNVAKSTVGKMGVQVAKDAILHSKGVSSVANAAANAAGSSATSATIRLPSGTIAAAAAPTTNSPIVAALRHLWSQGGIKAFFVGNGLNVVKVFPESAMKFGTFEAVKRLFAQIEGVDVTELSRASTFISGGLGGMAAQLTIYPIDTLKFRVQCSAQFSPYKGNQLLVETIRSTLAEGGVGIFYRGIHVGVLGIFPFAALDLGIFSALKKAYIHSQSVKYNIDPSEVKLANIVVLTMGALSGSLGASAVYPVNLLRTRLQAQGTAAHPYHYTGFRDVLRKTVERDGYKGLFRGLGPNLAKVAPAVSISYLVYEKAKTTMNLS